MTEGRTHCVLAASVLLLSACNLPPRNNPHDPQGDPIPRLRIGVSTAQGIDYQSQDGSRQTVFVLDASESTDPLGRPTTFDFDLDDPHWDAAPSDDFEVHGGSNPTWMGPLPLTSGMLAAESGGAGSAIRNVRVRVTAGGHSAIATAQLIVHNAAPLVDPGEDLIVSLDRPAVTLDACGGAQAPEGCTSSDPDGDPLHFSWAAPPGVSLALLDSAGRFARFTPQPNGPASYRFGLTATDGLATRQSRLSVHVGPQVWASFQQPSALFRVFPDHYASFSAVTTATAGSIALSAYQETLTVDESANVLLSQISPTPAILELDHEMNEVMRWNIGPQFGANPVSFAYSDGHCAIVRGDVAGALAFEFLRADGAVIAKSDPDQGNTTRGAQFVGASPDGGCFTFGSQIGKFDAAGAWTAVSTLPFYDITGATVLEDGTACVAGDIIAPSADYGIWCFPPGATPATPAEHAVMSPFWSALTPGTEPGTLLAFKFDEGRIERVDRVTGEAVPVDGIPQFVFVHQPTIGLARDTGSLWVVDEQSETLHRYDVAGTQAEETAAVTVGSVVGPGGFEWKSLSIDQYSGDAWLAIRNQAGGLSPGYVARFPWHGRVADALPGLVSGHSEISADPTRGYVWFTDDANTFIGRGLSVRSDRGRIVAAPSLPQGENWGHVTARSTGGAWVADHSFGQPDLERLLRLDADLGIQQEIALPGTEVLSIGLSRDDAHLCVAARDSAGDPHVIGLRCDAASGACDSFQTPISSVDNAFAVAFAAAANDGTCWFRGDGVSSGTGELVRIGPSAVAPDPSIAVSSISYGAPPCHTLVLDPRDDHPWVAGPPGVLVFDTAGNPLASFAPSPGVICLALAKKCADSLDPACVEAWSLAGYPSVLQRSTGDLDAAPLETYALPAGFGRGLDVR